MIVVNPVVQFEFSKEGEERGMGSVRVVRPEIGVANGGSRPGREVGEPPLSLRMGTGGVSN